MQFHGAGVSSPLGTAIGYLANHWGARKRYLNAGYLAIDNNLSERTLRAVALGRNNWGVLGGEAGGRTAAVLYSVVGTCEHLGIDPFACLRDALPGLFALGDEPTDEQLVEWLPDLWQLRSDFTTGYGFPYLIAIAALYGIESRLSPRGKQYPHGSGLGTQRYVVERTMAWWNHFRRINRCYERTPAHFQGLHELAAFVLSANKLRAAIPLHTSLLFTIEQSCGRDVLGLGEPGSRRFRFLWSSCGLPIPLQVRPLGQPFD